VHLISYCSKLSQLRVCPLHNDFGTSYMQSWTSESVGTRAMADVQYVHDVFFFPVTLYASYGKGYTHSIIKYTLKKERNKQQGDRTIYTTYNCYIMCDIILK